VSNRKAVVPDDQGSGFVIRPNVEVGAFGNVICHSFSTMTARREARLPKRKLSKLSDSSCLYPTMYLVKPLLT
jgi:hypothetical protein